VILKILIYSLLFTMADMQKVPPMFACKADSECSKVPTVCGRQTSVNKKFEAQWAEQVKQDQMVSSCLQPKNEELEADKKAKAICAKGRCDLK
jgi:hypothetical protein